MKWIILEIKFKSLIPRQERSTQWNIALARREAERVGPNTLLVIERLLSEDRFPLKNLRRVQGIISLFKQFEMEAMEYGCEQVLHFESLNYDHIRRFAKGYRPKKVDNLNISPIRQMELMPTRRITMIEAERLLNDL